MKHIIIIVRKVMQVLFPIVKVNGITLRRGFTTCFGDTALERLTGGCIGCIPIEIGLGPRTCDTCEEHGMICRIP